MIDHHYNLMIDFLTFLVVGFPGALSEYVALETEMTPPSGFSTATFNVSWNRCSKCGIHSRRARTPEDQVR
jgi:hypothetical protein